MDAQATHNGRREVDIDIGPLRLSGSVGLPSRARGVVVFAHGSGSGRFSPRNQFVARMLEREGWATVLFDLLTAQEEEAERLSRHLRFDIDLLAGRLAGATHWLATQDDLVSLPIAYFGASTGAAAALVAATQPDAPSIAAVVSRGGRPDLAGPALAQVRAPTLLIVGSRDTQVIDLNQLALVQLRGVAELQLVRGASHLFVEPGTLEAAAGLAVDWFGRHMPAGPP